MAIDFNEALGKPISFLTNKVEEFQEIKNQETINKIGLRVESVGGKYTLHYPNIHPNDRSKIEESTLKERSLKEILEYIKRRGLDKDFPDYRKIINDQTGQEEPAQIDFPKGNYREVTMKIVSIGRKWIKGTYPGKTFKYEILKNNISESFEVGQQYTFDAAVEDKSTKYGKKITVTPIDQSTKEKIKQDTNESEVERWLGYVEDYVEKGDGYLYPKGMEKLKELGVEKYPDLQKRLDQAIEKAGEDKEKGKVSKLHKTAKQYLGYIDDHIDDYWYNNGENKVLEVIEKLDAAGEDTEGIKSQLSDLKEQWEEQEKRKEKTDEKTGEVYSGEIYSIGGGSGYGYTEFITGTVIQNWTNRIKKGEPEFLYILSANKRYYRDDGLSFGVGDDQGYIYSAKAREATDEESASLRGKIQEKKEIFTQKKNLEAIEKEIKKRGELPSGQNSPEGERYADTQNIYGSGDWFVIGKDYIWYVQNNGMDGDNWANNNVLTGGAGAIGWRIPYDKEIADQIIAADRIAFRKSG